MICISIHALRVEGDEWSRATRAAGSYFYPRPPGGGRPYSADQRSIACVVISIHALRVEGDKNMGSAWKLKKYFYPRPPGEGRLFNSFDIFFVVVFLSTPSGWRATGLWLNNGVIYYISIHALRVEGDCGYRLRRARISYFYPRPPGGGRLPVVTPDADSIRISIHALRVEGDAERVSGCN